MADFDYDPVTANPDEDEEARKYPYPPAMAQPAPIAASAGPTAMPSPDPGPPMSAMTGPSAGPPPVIATGAPQMPTLGAQRPHWKDYAPADPHGWSKFGHALAALNPATDRIFNRGPEQRAEKAYGAATNEFNQGETEDLKNKQEQRAEAGETRQESAEQSKSELEAAQAQKAGEETWKSVPGMVGPGGKVLQESSKGAIRWAPGIEGAGPAKPPGEEGLDKQYQDALAAGDHAKAERILQVKADLAKAGQAPERPQKPQQQLAVIDGKVVELKPGMVVPKGTESLSGDLKGSKPSADESRRSDLSRNMNENLDQLEEIVQRRPDLFGPVAGRWTGLKEMVGTDDPDIGKLHTIKEQMGMAMVGAHAMRNAQHVEAAANSIINSFKNGGPAVLASMKAARDSLATFQQDAGDQRGNVPKGSPGGAQHVPGGKAQGLQEGATGKGSDHKPYVVKGGVWVPQ
jgi:hypothetical protein